MAADNGKREVANLLATPHLADALGSDRFRRFLDQIPIAIIVSRIDGAEHIVYANPEFEKLTGQNAAEVEGRAWDVLRGSGHGQNQQRPVGIAIAEGTEFVGTFRLNSNGGDAAVIDAYSNLIEDEHGKPAFRLAALVDVGLHERAGNELQSQLREKDLLLRELQHRVKNNLQMITALIRLEARRAPSESSTAQFQRLAGRIDALSTLYHLLSDSAGQDQIDLGAYLSEVASTAMRTYAVDGIRLNMKVDAYPVTLNVAMPAGLIVNELLTNALKHAFAGRDAGSITLHSLADDRFCRVIVADDGVGFPSGVEWPRQGNLGALIVQSLRENANAELHFESDREKGTRITIVFSREAAFGDPAEG
jgi:PAS domain S-box-containing protein